MYRLTWKDKNNKSCVLTINDGNNTITDMPASPSPFTTEMDDDDNFFAPIRLQSGTINVVSEIGELDGIIGDTPLDRAVTLKVDGVVKWKGFLQSTVYTQAYIGGKNEVSIPVVSPLSLLESIYPRWMSLGYISFANILEEINAELGYPYSEIVVPTRIDAPTTFQYKINKYLYTERNDRNPQIYDTKSYKDILTDMCNVFGLQIFEWGETLVFMQRDVEPDYDVYNINDITEPINGTSLIIKPNAINNNTLASDDHNISYVAGKKSIEVTGTFEPFDYEICDISVPNGYCQYITSEYKSTFDILGEYLIYAASAYSNYFVTTSIRKTDATKPDVKTLKMGNLNVSWQDDNKIYYGSVLVKEKITDRKGDGEFKNGLLMYNAINTEIKAAEVETPIHFIKERTTSNNLLNISADIKIASKARNPFDTASECDIYIAIIQSDGKYFKQSQKYDCGGTWDDNFYCNTFKCKNGKLCQYLAGVQGSEDKLIIQVGDLTSYGVTANGPIKLEFYLAPNNVDSNYYLINNLKISVTPGWTQDSIFYWYDITSADYDEERKENSISSIIGSGFLDDYSVKSALTCAQSMERGLGIIYTSDLNTLPSTLNTDGDYPENDYADRLIYYYSKSRCKLEVNLKKDTINYFDTISQGNKVFVPVAKSINWRDATEKITLLELPS